MKRIILIMSLILFSFNTFALSQQEKNDLIFMYQEEKLAHDVYTQFYKIYNNKVFGNIAKSELKHMTEIENLLKYYKIEVPNLKEGEFQNKELQKLYLDLLNQGKKSKVEAFKVGILIEDKDILDLNKSIKNSSKEIQNVYKNLLKGSENHKNAFLKQLK